MTYLTGFHAIEESLKAGSGTALLSARPGPRAGELVKLAAARRVRVDRIGAAELDRLAPGNRGIALAVEGDTALAGPVPYASTDDFIAGLGNTANALALILDEITDPHNYGAILRSCDQFGVDLVVSRKRRNAKHAAVIAQTSAGAAAWVPQLEEPNLVRAVDILKQGGFWIYGADRRGEPACRKDLKGRVAIILGGEAGLSRLLRESCDGLVAVPAFGRVDSLNVSVAAGILLYEAIRQRAGQRGAAKSGRPEQ
ncbi:MAG: 23S rRNA (guanosine(2251)-2'-O)-methyltransferase RlmB [Treponema sp.]|jgi:23S rRNA (guanosine2251-2'-O)-methyltransferase|nr:23S rRNA (guanosine(2251)-2'-O)-methyltransferase RlmB [Treponema sp.]